MDLLDIIVLSQVNALLSVFSDLLESFFKRCAGVKVRNGVKFVLSISLSY
jgi:hypothetical protein